MRKHRKAINLPTIERLMYGWRNITLSGKALEDLLSIEEAMRPLAPIGDDSLRGVWIYVHRGRPADWYTVKEAIEEEVIQTKEDYLKTWHDYYPDKGRWYFVKTAHYQDSHWLYISDKVGHYCSLKSAHDDGAFDDFEWFTQELLEMINNTVKYVLQDATRFNAKVSKGLDYMQRIGRIPRAQYYKICSDEIVQPREPERAMKILKDIIEHPREPLSKMTIRLYCRYYKIACLAEKDHRKTLDYNKENLDFIRQETSILFPPISGLIAKSLSSASAV